MQKKLLLFLVLSLLFFSTSQVQAASLFVVSKDGNVERNVLGDSTDINATVQKVSQKVATAAIEGVKEIAIAEIENKTQVKIITDKESQEQTVPTALTELVEMEGDHLSDKVSVTKTDEGFGISDKGITANTSFNVSIKPKEHDVFVESSLGSTKLSVLPSEAVKNVVSSGAINVLPADGIISLQSDGDKLNYLVKGERIVQIFHIAKVVVPVSSSVSADTGKVTIVDQPQWLSLFGFLLS
jgi:hypothetical protein